MRASPRLLRTSVGVDDHTLRPQVTELPDSYSTSTFIFFSSPGRLSESALQSWTSTSSDFHSAKRGAGHGYMIR